MLYWVKIFNLNTRIDNSGFNKCEMLQLQWFLFEQVCKTYRTFSFDIQFWDMLMNFKTIIWGNNQYMNLIKYHQKIPVYGTRIKKKVGYKHTSGMSIYVDQMCHIRIIWRKQRFQVSFYKLQNVTVVQRLRRLVWYKHKLYGRSLNPF